METFNSRKEIEKSQNYEEELLMIDQFLFHLPKIFMKSDDLASISSEENCPEENFNDCSDLENDVGNFESKKVPQDWDKEVGLKLFKRDGNILCSECKFSTLTKVNAISHVQANHVDNFVGYKCDECGKVSTTIKTLESHMTKYHSVSMPKYLARSIQIQ